MPGSYHVSSGLISNTFTPATATSSFMIRQRFNGWGVDFTIGVKRDKTDYALI